MFTNHCPSCDKRQLIFPSQITGVAHADSDAHSGLAVTYTCWCGVEQVWRGDAVSALAA